MSKDNENKKLYESIPGSSKDTNGEQNNNGDQQRDSENELEKIKKNIGNNNEIQNQDINSQDSIQFSGEISRIRKMEGFVYMRIPLDGGYAWIILIAAFLSLLNVDGMRMSIGRLLPNIIRDMGISNEQAALIASLQIGFYYISGPFTCALIHKTGYRTVSALGACISILGNLIGSISSNFICLILSFGIAAGIGYGMIAIATQIIVGFYFEKYRPIAFGIYSAGSGFGILIFSPLYNFIIINYGWRNVLLCQSVFAFVVLILTIFYRQVKPTRIGQQYIEDNNIDDISYDSVESLEISSAYFPNIGNSSSDISVKSNKTKQKANKTLSNDKLPKPKKKNYISFLSHCFKRKHVEHPATYRSAKDLLKHINVNPMDRQDIFYVGKPDYQEPVAKPLNQIEFLTTPIDKTRSIQYTMSVTKPFRKDKQEMDHKPKFKVTQLFFSTFKLFIDPTLLDTKEFRYFITSSFLATLGGNVPVLYITEHVEIPAFYANYLLSSFGFANIIFRISSGFLAYYLKTNPLYLAGIPLAISGIFTVLTGFFGKDIIWYQFLYTIILGSGYAFTSSLRSIICVQLLGLDKLTNATGLTALAMGIGSFMGTNLGGLIKSKTKTTNYTFVFSGIALFLGGILYILLPQLIKKRSNPNSNRGK